MACTSIYLTTVKCAANNIAHVSIHQFVPIPNDSVLARVHLRFTLYHSRVSPGKKEPMPAPCPVGCRAPRCGLLAETSCLRSSGRRAAWIWRRKWHPSTPCRRGPLHSRSVGRSPGRANPSCVVSCTLHLDVAPACKFSSRSDGRNSGPQSSRKIADKGRPRDLRN